MFRECFMLCFFVFSSTSEKDFVIFKPGEFFDPFVEKSSNQNIRKVAHQPNAIFGGPNTIFSQAFGQTYGYPRALGLTSGTRDQFNAQIWQPNSFFANFHQPPAKQSIKRPAIAEFSVSKKISVGENLPKITHKKPEVNILKSESSIPSPLIAQPSNMVGQGSEDKSYSSSHSASKSAGAGQNHSSEHHKDYDEKETESYKSNHHKSVGDHEKHEDHHKENDYKKKGGNVQKHHDESGNYKKHHEGKKSHKSAKFGEKKGHKKGHKTKGYHNKFHRDEYHREHRFYDDAHKEGYHEKHGDAHSYYKKKEGGHKKGGSHKSGKSGKKHGKKEHSKKGKYVDDNKGFSREGGRKKYDNHHREHGKKHDSVKGKKYGYHHKS